MSKQFLYVIPFLILLFSCDSEKNRMIKGLSGNYKVDTTVGGYRILSKPIYTTLQLRLLENGEYYFKPAIKLLKGYEGKWTLSNDSEYSYYIFKCSNGKYQSNQALSIVIENNSRLDTIYFH